MKITLSKEFKMPDGTFVKILDLKEPSSELILNQGLPRTIEMSMDGQTLQSMRPTVNRTILKRYIEQMTGIGESLLLTMHWEDLVAIEEAVLDFLQPLGTVKENAKPSSSI